MRPVLFVPIRSLSTVYSKVVFVSRMEFLDEYVDVSSQIDIPEAVLDHDRALEQHPLMDYGLQLDPVLSRAQVVGEVPSAAPCHVQRDAEE